MTITHLGTLHANPGKVDDLIASFEGLKSAKGYVSHQCYQSIEDTNKITLVEKWESKEDHQQFVQNFPKEAMDESFS
jgi:heme-degrading monooxygenase HmoA